MLNFICLTIQGLLSEYIYVILWLFQTNYNMHLLYLCMCYFKWRPICSASLIVCRDSSLQQPEPREPGRWVNTHRVQVARIQCVCVCVCVSVCVCVCVCALTSSYLWLFREQFIRLQHENKMLRLQQEECEREKIAALQGELEDAHKTRSELDTENRSTLSYSWKLGQNLAIFSGGMFTGWKAESEDWIVTSVTSSVSLFLNFQTRVVKWEDVYDEFYLVSIQIKHPVVQWLLPSC